MGRFAFILARLFQTIPLLLGITLLVFLLLHVTPGDPARSIAGLRASEEAVQEIRERLDLDEPLIRQYIGYVGRVLRGDLGTSIRSRQPVSATITRHLPVTLWLLGAGVLFSLAFTVPLASLAARHRDRLLDHAVRGASLFALTMPPFWVGIMLLLAVAIPTGLFPVGGFGDTLFDRLRAIVLPGLTLGIALAPIQVRSLRSAMIRVLESDYIEAARSIGVRGRRLVWGHVLRNAIPPTVTLLAVQVGFMLFGAVVVEATFDLPGLGDQMLLAAERRDFPVVQGITLIFAVLVVGVHLLADVVHAILDPRVEL